MMDYAQLSSLLTLQSGVAALLAAIGTAALLTGLRYTVRARLVGRRVHAFVVAEPVQLPVAPPVAPSLPRGEVAKRLRARLVRSLNRRVVRFSFGAALQRRLLRAGLSLAATDFMLLQAGAAALCAFAANTFLPVALRPFALTFDLLGAFIGVLVSLLVLRQLERRRLAAFEAQLPGTIDTIAGTLQAGSSLGQAIEAISRESAPPVSVEFVRVLRDLDVGLSLPDALVRMQERLPSTDLMLLNSAIGIQARIGGDLAPILRTISHTIRERLRVRSEIRVFTAQARYSGYIVSLLPLVLFVFMWFTSYDYVSQLLLPGTMRLLLFTGIAALVLGFISMQRMARIEV